MDVDPTTLQSSLNVPVEVGDISPGARGVPRSPFLIIQNELWLRVNPEDMVGSKARGCVVRCDLDLCAIYSL